MRTFINFLLISFMLVSFIEAGPAAYGICQTGCNAAAVACYAAAGATMGVTFGASAPPAVLACSTAQGFCMTMCIAAGCAPTL
uniref:Cysteine-rich protein n=1 Tax=Tetranychus urticae TaxID=32264 RepID=T1JSV1_TETUR